MLKLIYGVILPLIVWLYMSNPQDEQKTDVIYTLGTIYRYYIEFYEVDGAGEEFGCLKASDKDSIDRDRLCSECCKWVC